MLFGALDDDMSGTIELAEVQKGQFAAMAPMMMGMLDKDGNKLIDKEEMAAGAMQMMRRQFSQQSNGEKNQAVERATSNAASSTGGSN